MSATKAKENFLNYATQHPEPHNIISYIESQFTGSGVIVGMVQQAVTLVAQQLNCHFILELMQNFEDNKYGSAIPKVYFHLQNDLLFVACNEIGMAPIDVYSLCNIGDSTKKHNKADTHGYIGEKGIGFKSVFKVAHTVQIYSCSDTEGDIWSFDLTEELRREIPYIVPHNLNSPMPPLVLCSLRKVCEGTNRPSLGGTCLVLQLKSEKIALVQKQLSQLEPCDFIFLQRIHNLFLLGHNQDRGRGNFGAHGQGAKAGECDPPENTTESLPSVTTSPSRNTSESNLTPTKSNMKSPPKNPRIAAPPREPDHSPRSPNSYLLAPIKRNGQKLGKRKISYDRPNQASIRESALQRYQSCIVTGTTQEAVLEAAHIKAKRDGDENIDDDDNILLLRSDIHKLFDFNPPLLYFTRSKHEGHVQVHFTGGTENDPSYQPFNNKDIQLPPSTIALLLEYGPQPPL